MNIRILCSYSSVDLAMFSELLLYARYYVHALYAHLTFLFVCFCHLHCCLLGLGWYHPSHGLLCRKFWELTLFPLWSLTTYSEIMLKCISQIIQPNPQTLSKILYSIWNKISSSYCYLQGSNFSALPFVFYPEVSWLFLTTPPWPLCFKGPEFLSHVFPQLRMWLFFHCL